VRDASRRRSHYKPFCDANLVGARALVQGLLPPERMAIKRPALRAMPTPDQTRARQLQHDVTSIVRRHLDDACVRAWTEIAQRFGTRPLFANSDPSAVEADRATRSLVTLLANGLSRLAVAALLLPSRVTQPSRRRFTPPTLAAIPGGLQGNGHGNGHVPKG
jgi:hypothetical protein